MMTLLFIAIVVLYFLPCLLACFQQQGFGFYVQEIGKDMMRHEKLLVAGCGSGMEVLYGYIIGIRDIFAYDSDQEDYQRAIKVYSESQASISDGLRGDLPSPHGFSSMFSKRAINIQEGMKASDLFPQDGTTIAHFMANLNFDLVIVLFVALVYSQRCAHVKYVMLNGRRQPDGKSTNALIESFIPKEAIVYQNKQARFEGSAGSISFYILRMDDRCRQVLKENLEKKPHLTSSGVVLDMTVSVG